MFSSSYFQLKIEFLISQLVLIFPLQIIERTNVFSERYDILGFTNFLYLLQITQYNLFIFLVIENILLIFYHSSHNH